MVVDSDPDFPVLNLAQAVVCCCYELHPLIRKQTASVSGEAALVSASQSGTSSRSFDNSSSSSGSIGSGSSRSSSGSGGNFSIDHSDSSGFSRSLSSSSGGIDSGNFGLSTSFDSGSSNSGGQLPGSLQQQLDDDVAVVPQLSGSPLRPDLANVQDLATLADAEGFLEHLFAELETAGELSNQRGR